MGLEKAGEMGNRRFKLSDMVPNAMFYKLKGMNRAPPDLPRCQDSSLLSSNTEKTRQYHSAGTSLPRKSYHAPRDISGALPDPPRRSSKQGRIAGKSKPRSASSSSACSFGCHASSESTWTRTEHASSPDSTFGSSSTEFRLDRVLAPESLGSCGSRVDRVVNDPDIVIDVDQNSSIRKPERATRNRYFESLPNFELPRIVTKPAKPNHSHKTNHVDAEDRVAEKPTKKAGENGSRKSASKRCSISSSPRLRLKIKSPRPTSRRPTQARRAGSGFACGQSDPPTVRTKLSGSFAVVKSSFDPQRDFRESMVEMIVEHNIKASKDLEELLACYLSLNTNEYHELIIEVFKQIWFDLADHDSFD